VLGIVLGAVEAAALELESGTAVAGFVASGLRLHSDGFVFANFLCGGGLPRLVLGRRCRCRALGHGLWPRHTGLELEHGVELLLHAIGAALEATFLRVEVGHDLVLDETDECHGHDVVRAALSVFRFCSQFGHFVVPCLGFDDGDTAEPPPEFREFDDEGVVVASGGAVGVEVSVDEFSIFFGVLVREEGLAGRESVGNGVAGGDGFAGFGDGSGGEGGVEAVGFELGWGHVLVLLSFPGNEKSARQRGALVECITLYC
jgi:hypothetical protein